MSPALAVELLTARRAFPEAQRVLAAERTLRRLPFSVEVGWHDTRVHHEAGSFALVRRAAAVGVRPGEVVCVTAALTHRSVFVYVVAHEAISTDLSLSRRAFLALGLLTHETLHCTIEVAA
jgi:hypothetical protein